MRIRIIFLLAISFIVITGVFAHPVYVSMTNIEYIPEENQLAVSVKLNLNDLLSLIQVQYGYHFSSYATAHFTDREHQLIEKFISEQLQVFADSVLVPLTFVGTNQKTEDIWVNFTSSINASTKSLMFHNSLFLFAYSQQKNLLIFSSGKFEKGLMFDRETQWQSILFPTISSKL